VSPKLHTLTVPDMLWINLQLTGETVPYHYARLEEAVFTQFGHGSSRDVLAQAARFLTEFARLRPFARGNDACAFVGCLAFLAMNGHELRIRDQEAAQWVREVWADPDSALAKIKERVTARDDDHGAHPDHYETARSVLDQFPSTLRELVKHEAPVPVG
jgi:prophage maintenance system killer protein